MDFESFISQLYSHTSDDFINEDERLNIYKQEVEKDEIDDHRIRILSFRGIPQKMRPIYWKLLLNVLPCSKNLWDSVLKQKRDEYTKSCSDLIHENGIYLEEIQDCYDGIYNDHEAVENIHKDLQRSYPNRYSQALNIVDIDVPYLNNPHCQALRRILIVWSRLHPSIGYVQGMHDILAPLYFLFVSDSDENSRKHAEEDAFLCFTNLLVEIINNFCGRLDNSEAGIFSRMTKLSDLLKTKDPVLWQNLNKKNLTPQFYSFRWLTLLLSQEFEPHDVYRLWDTLFSDDERFEFLIYVCCSILIYHREELIKGDYSDNLRILQDYPKNFKEIIKLANRVKNPEFIAETPKQVLEKKRSFFQNIFNFDT